MKKAILSVSYGSSDESQIENTIDRVENEYRRAFPETGDVSARRIALPGLFRKEQV